MHPTAVSNQKRKSGLHARKRTNVALPNTIAKRVGCHGMTFARVAVWKALASKIGLSCACATIVGTCRHKEARWQEQNGFNEHLCRDFSPTNDHAWRSSTTYVGLTLYGFMQDFK